MSTNQKIKADIQTLNIDSALVDLYILDATAVGGGRYYFTPHYEGGSNIVFNGITYYALPVSFTGIEISGVSVSRPRMQVSNINSTFVGLINASNDAVGCKVLRLRTFQKYIDGHAEADPSAQFPMQVFYIEQKTQQNSSIIEWELVSALDFGNRMLPKNKVLSYCIRRYRIYRNGAMNYSKSNCPYALPIYFTQDGSSTTIDKDVCSKKLSDCERRYPGQWLPFKGAPGISQFGRAYR